MLCAPRYEIQENSYGTSVLLSRVGERMSVFVDAS